MNVTTHFAVALAILFALLVAGCAANYISDSFEKINLDTVSRNQSEK